MRKDHHPRAPRSSPPSTTPRTSPSPAAPTRARELGYLSLSAEDFDGQEADESFNDLVQEGRSDGLLIASARPGHPLLDALSRSAVPHVFLNRSVEGSGRNVTMDVANPARIHAQGTCATSAPRWAGRGSRGRFSAGCVLVGSPGFRGRY
jgi:hypothetical protein